MRIISEFPVLGPDVVALNEHSCFYLNVLAEYGLPELTPHFCLLDDFLFEGVSPCIRWERTQTIGRGGEMCDFRYYLVKHPME
ncbi:MAG: L-2-amino-thiazoline-4-carboxylic acid hydrolase [Candidatus Atribacteria bacterium]|nr:L-2-amino-thiazoline-4-carboxylic acid hydrolase [Candidatus Atribacteria bacterium]